LSSSFTPFDPLLSALIAAPDEGVSETERYASPHRAKKDRAENAGWHLIC